MRIAEPGARTKMLVSVPYENLVVKLMNEDRLVRYCGSTSCMPYLFSKDSDILTSCDNPRSLRDKCNYIKARELRGVIS